MSGTGSAKRFQDAGEHWETFAVHSLVACSRCGGQAEVRGPRDGFFGTGTWRLTCAGCGLVREDSLLYKVWQASELPPVDPVFKCELWLQTPCCGETLWAFDLGHLAFLERYVGAELRRGMPTAEERPAIRNATLASRLPRWMIDGHRREDVLHGLKRLRERASKMK